MPVASLIIPQHGREELTLSAVRSFANQHSLERFEVIVVDDGSPPGVVRRLQRSLPPEVTMLREPRQRGVTAAWNVGAAASRGDVLVFLNNDTVSLAPWLTMLLEQLAPAGARSPLCMCGVETRVESHLPPRWRQLASQRWLAGWCLALNREVFTALSGFDERFRMYFSDTDLQLRLRLSAGEGSLRCWAAAGALRHLGHQSTRHWSPRGAVWRADRERFWRKYRDVGGEACT